MAAIAIPPRPRLDPLVARRRAPAGDRPLTFVGVAMLLAFAATFVGLVVDDRVITGALAWSKPARFAVPIAIYTFRLAWLLGFLRGRRHLIVASSARARSWGCCLRRS